MVTPASNELLTSETPDAIQCLTHHLEIYRRRVKCWPACRHFRARNLVHHHSERLISASAQNPNHHPAEPEHGTAGAIETPRARVRKGYWFFLQDNYNGYEG